MVSSQPPHQSSLPILKSLPNPSISEEACPRRARLQIDLILLAIEALDLHGSSAILVVARELDLQSLVKNRVSLWRLRNTNPFRKLSLRRNLSLVEAKALIVIATNLSRRLVVLIRQLLLAYQQQQEGKQVLPEYQFRLDSYLLRFRSHFRGRMNMKRSAMTVYQTDAALNDLAIKLLTQLLFSTGTAGQQRLWISLFDGEVA